MALGNFVPIVNQAAPLAPYVRQLASQLVPMAALAANLYAIGAQIEGGVGNYAGVEQEFGLGAGDGEALLGILNQCQSALKTADALALPQRVY